MRRRRRSPTRTGPASPGPTSLTDDLVRPAFSVVDAATGDTVVRVLTAIEAA